MLIGIDSSPCSLSIRNRSMWDVLGRCIFTTQRGVLEKFFFVINFIGVNLEAGNETREKIWIDYVAEQNEERIENRVVYLFISLFSREGEIEV